MRFSAALVVRLGLVTASTGQNEEIGVSTGGGIGAFMEGAFGGYSAARQIDRQAEIDKLLSGRSIYNPATTPAATPGPTTPAAPLGPEQFYARNAVWMKPGVDPSSFNTNLGDKEADFRKWVAANKVPFDPDATSPQDYDMRGFYKALQSGDNIAKSSVNANDGKLHYPDVWKTPYHRTFSNGSQWATPDAPAWNDKDQLIDKGGNVIFDERAARPAQMTPRGVIAPTTPGPAVASRAVSNPNAAKEMYDYIVSKGVSHEHALGMITNMQGESGFNPAAYNPNDLGAPSGGLFQHHKDRLSAMEKAVPDWKTNWKGQIDYALGERETQKYLGTKYKDGSEATAGFVEQFEKPKDARQAIAQRTGFLPSIERVVTRPQNGMRSDGIMDFMSSRFPIPRGL
jgi:hypothetical protein